MARYRTIEMEKVSCVLPGHRFEARREGTFVMELALVRYFCTFAPPLSEVHFWSTRLENLSPLTIGVFPGEQ